MAKGAEEGVDKGKSKAADQSAPDLSHERTQEPRESSLGSRIVASASGLARDLIAGADTVRESLSQTAASSGKVRPAVHSSSHDRSAEATQIASTSAATDKTAAATSESFRTAGTGSSTVEAFEEFQSQKAPDFGPLEHSQQPNGSSAWANEFTLGSNHVKEYSAEDGLEVSQLLSDPYFVAMTEEAAPEPTQSATDAANLFGDNFDAETAQAAKTIKDDLPAPPIHQPVAADHPRNLVANLEAFLADHEFETSAGSYSASSMVHFHSQEQQREFYSQWSGVLNQYTDEVWGDMLPVVQEEKQHAEAIKQGKEFPDSKSVQRLNMILGHVEQYRHTKH